MRLKRLDWDSRFFGYPVGALALPQSPDLTAEIHAGLAEARAKDFRLLYLFLAPGAEEIREGLVRAGAFYAGCKVDYSKPVAPAALPPPGAELSACRENSRALEQLAFQSGAHSRFRLDPRFRNQEFERLYREWLASSLRGDAGKRVFIAGSAAAPRGLVTVEPGEPFRIGLLAVDAGQRGQGLGHRLLAAAERFSHDNQAQELRVATQAENQGACRFYENCGFRILSKTDIFHVWLKPA